MVGQIGGGLSITSVSNGSVNAREDLLNNTNGSMKSQSVPSTDSGEGKESLSKRQLEKVVSGLNEFAQVTNNHLKFEYHEKLNEYYVTVVDEVTQEVVREIPPKKMLDIFAAMTEYLGLMVDKKI